jgi:hypothetical protein
MHKDASDALLLAAYAHHAVVVLSPWRFFLRDRFHFAR